MSKLDLKNLQTECLYCGRVPAQTLFVGGNWYLPPVFCSAECAAIYGAHIANSNRWFCLDCFQWIETPRARHRCCGHLQPSLN